MRTIKITIISLLCLCTHHLLLAQTQQKPNCYKGKSVIHGNGVSYNVDDNNTVYALFNTKNVKMDAPFLFKDGTPVPPEDYIMYMPKRISDEPLYKAFRETFSQEQINNFKATDEKMTIYYALDSIGNTIEVGFRIKNNDNMCNVPIDQLYLLEQNIIKYVKYSPTENTKKLQFTSIMRSFHFKDL